MNKVKKEEILGLLDAEIGKIRQSAKKTDEASKQKLTGWSASGDKYHAQAASDLVDSYLKRLELLKKELKGASNESLKTVNSPCFLKVKYLDGNVHELFLVKNAVSVPGVSFISTDSPIGESVLGKKQADTFNYELTDGKKYSGEIVALD